MSSWYYERSISDAGQKRPKQKEVAKSYPSVGLIIGVTGIAGSSLANTLSLADTPGGPWKIYGVARRPCPSWLAENNIEYIQCDVANPTETYSKLSPLTDVTHVFYMTWSGSEESTLNSIMFRNILDSVSLNAPILKHISVLTGVKYYLGNFSDMSNKNERHDCPFYEDLPRLNQDNFYHNLEDTLWELAAKKKDLTWSVHRPAVIFGVSPCSLMNMVSTLCVYAAICKHENKPLVYTGTEVSWTAFWDAVDADLLAEHFVWTATDPKAKNQAFNCNNGDVFTWKRLWKVLGKQFDLEAVGYVEGKEPVLLEDLMKGKDSVWDEIVEKNNLVPTKLRDIAAFRFADIAMRCSETLSSMNKNKEFGFMGFRDTTKSFISCVKKMRDHRFIP